MKHIEDILGVRIGGIVRSSRAKISEINKRYAQPKITMTRGTRLALLGLRLYLILLVILLGYKFFTIVTGGSTA